MVQTNRLIALITKQLVRLVDEQRAPASYALTTPRTVRHPRSARRAASNVSLEIVVIEPERDPLMLARGRRASGGPHGCP
jgi:hypothetical protein